MSHRIAKITKAGVTCDCGVVTASRAAHRAHKTTGEVAEIIKAAPKAPKAKGPKPIWWTTRRWDHESGATVEIQTDVSGLGLPEKSAVAFAALADDAGNWSGSPLMGGNVGWGRSNGGIMAKLNAAGLTTSYPDEDQPGCYWVNFTPKGRQLALDVLGFDPDPYTNESLPQD